MTTVQFKTPNFTAAADFDGFRCVKAEPVIGWMIGKDFKTITGRTIQRMWKLHVVLPEKQQQPDSPTR